MPPVNVYVVIDKQGYGESAIIGARLTREDAEALRTEVIDETSQDLELEDNEDPDVARDECDLRYEIVELGA